MIGNHDKHYVMKHVCYMTEVASELAENLEHKIAQDIIFVRHA